MIANPGSEAGRPMTVWSMFPSINQRRCIKRVLKTGAWKNRVLFDPRKADPSYRWILAENRHSFRTYQCNSI